MLKVSFEEDERRDMEILKETTGKSPQDVARYLADKFTKKYGHEFGGYVKVDYNAVEDAFVLELGKVHREVIERQDFLEIPERIRFFRERAASRKK